MSVCEWGADGADWAYRGMAMRESSFLAARNASCCHGCRDIPSTAQCEACSRTVDYEGERTLGGCGGESRHKYGRMAAGRRHTSEHCGISIASWLEDKS